VRPDRRSGGPPGRPRPRAATGIRLVLVIEGGHARPRLCLSASLWLKSGMRATTVARRGCRVLARDRCPVSVTWSGATTARQGPPGRALWPLPRGKEHCPGLPAAPCCGRLPVRPLGHLGPRAGAVLRRVQDIAGHKIGEESWYAATVDWILVGQSSPPVSVHAPSPLVLAPAPHGSPASGRPGCCSLASRENASPSCSRPTRSPWIRPSGTNGNHSSGSGHLRSPARRNFPRSSAAILA